MVLWFLAFMVAGAIIIALFFAEPATTREGAYQAGQAAQAKFGGISVVASLALTALGVYLGVLPGTRKLHQADRR
jgi:hypothetical protein